MLELGKSVQERLTALMNEAVPSREMQSRRDAWTFYQRCQTGWVDGTRNDWLAALKSKPKPSGVPVRNRWNDDLTLVDIDVMDNKILASRLVLGIMDKADKDPVTGAGGVTLAQFLTAMDTSETWTSVKPPAP